MKKHIVRTALILWQLKHIPALPRNLITLLRKKKHIVRIKICKLVGNKVKGRISKRVFQEKKARQIFRKTSISYPLRVRIRG